MFYFYYNWFRPTTIFYNWLKITHFRHILLTKAIGRTTMIFGNHWFSDFPDFKQLLLEKYVTEFQFFNVCEELRTRAFKWCIYRLIILSISRVIYNFRQCHTKKNEFSLNPLHLKLLTGVHQVFKFHFAPQKMRCTPDFFGVLHPRSEV